MHLILDIRTLLMLLWLLCSVTVSAEADNSDIENIDSAEQQAVVQAALQAAKTQHRPYRLTVACNSDKGARNMEVFTDGVAQWDDRLELMLQPDERMQLLELLIQQSFSSLAAEYGGRAQTQIGEAPLRRICVIDMHVDGVRKRSQQFMGGEQSEQLVKLAEALLDVIAPISQQRGIGADSLEDGLRKLLNGQLSEHAFKLRMLELPTDQIGSVLDIEGRMISYLPYAPGRTIGERYDIQYDSELIRLLQQTMLEAAIWAFPVNLWSEQQIELELRILQQHKSVSSRKFSGLQPDTLGQIQTRFDRMLDKLRITRAMIATKSASQQLTQTSRITRN